MLFSKHKHVSKSPSVGSPNNLSGATDRSSSPNGAADPPEPEELIKALQVNCVPRKTDLKQYLQSVVVLNGLSYETIQFCELCFYFLIL